MFATREMDFEIEEAFAGAREILQMLSLRSAQAAHYYEILTLLSDAITEQRQKQTNRSRGYYVGRIFSLDIRRPSTETRQEIGLREDPVAPAPAGSCGILDAWLQNDRSTPLPMEEGCDSLYLPLLDSFPFMTEPFIAAG
jgi:hypothetical protein